MLKTQEYLVEAADRCIQMAREGRQLVERLEAIGNEMMAKAVNSTPRGTEPETRRQARAGAHGLTVSLKWLTTKSPARAPGFLRFTFCGASAAAPRIASPPCGGKSTRRRQNIS